MKIHLWSSKKDGAVCGQHRLPHPDMRDIAYYPDLSTEDQWKKRHRFSVFSAHYSTKATWVSCGACKRTNRYRNKLLEEELTS